MVLPLRKKGERNKMMVLASTFWERLQHKGEPLLESWDLSIEFLDIYIKRFYMKYSLCKGKPSSFRTLKKVLEKEWEQTSYGSRLNKKFFLSFPNGLPLGEKIHNIMNFSFKEDSHRTLEKFLEREKVKMLLIKIYLFGRIAPKPPTKNFSYRSSPPSSAADVYLFCKPWNICMYSEMCNYSTALTKNVLQKKGNCYFVLIEPTNRSEKHTLDLWDINEQSRHDKLSQEQQQQHPWFGHGWVDEFVLSQSSEDGPWTDERVSGSYRARWSPLGQWGGR